MSETARLRGRPVTNEEAMDAAQRFIDEHFKNSDKPRVDTRIPAQATDHDVVLMDYLRESAALQARIATLEQERDIANKLDEAEQWAEALRMALATEHAKYVRHQTREEWVAVVGWDADAGKTDPAEIIWRPPEVWCSVCRLLTAPPTQPQPDPR